MSAKVYQQHSYCSFCGTLYETEAWPRQCGYCGRLTFLNPTPVAVLIQPVDQGVLTVRRNVAPQVGYLALPGGYVDIDESWQAAAARELFEEAGIHITAEEIQLFNVLSVPRNLLIFGIGPQLTAAELPPFQPNDEASERLIVTEAVELAFPAHTEMLKQYLQGEKYLL